MSDIIIPSTTVIRDVSHSMKMLLVGGISDLEEGNVGFDSPGEYTPPGTKSLSLFLFQVKVNPYLRNTPKTVVTSHVDDITGKNIKAVINPPVTLDLMYMLTPFGQNVEMEYELTEQIIGTLYDHAVLQGDDLQGTLPEQGNERIHINPIEFGMETINNIWSIFPNKSYKVSLFYVLSPVRIQPSVHLDYAEVDTVNVDLRRK